MKFGANVFDQPQPLKLTRRRFSYDVGFRKTLSGLARTGIIILPNRAVANDIGQFSTAIGLIDCYEDARAAPVKLGKLRRYNAKRAGYNRGKAWGFPCFIIIDGLKREAFGDGIECEQKSLCHA
jgi:hypothetical protein